MIIIFSLGEPAGTLVNYRALYRFEARNHDEMSFNSGDIIQVGNSLFFFLMNKLSALYYITFNNNIEYTIMGLPWWLRQ